MPAEPAIKTQHESSAPLFHLATRAPHDFSGPRLVVLKGASQSGFEEHHKTCARCGLSRITRIGSAEPRAYRVADGPQFFVDVEPSCVVGVKG